MPHVELSLSEPVLPQVSSASLDRWAAATRGAAEACLVLDADAVIVAASASCAEMIGLGDPGTARGRKLLDAVVRLIDFTSKRYDLDGAEADKIPPLLAIKSSRLARGLMRLECPISATTSTMDAVATPLWDDGTVVGSLTFFTKV